MAKKTYQMVMWYALTYHITHTKCYSMYATNHSIISRMLMTGRLAPTRSWSSTIITATASTFLKIQPSFLAITFIVITFYCHILQSLKRFLKKRSCGNLLIWTNLTFYSNILFLLIMVSCFLNKSSYIL